MAFSTYSGTEDEEHTHCITLIPLARNLLMVLVDCSVPFVFLAVFSIALLLLFCSYLDIQTLRIFVMFVGSILGFDWVVEVYTWFTDRGVPKRCDGGWWWCLSSLSLPFFSGADDLVTRVSNGTKGRRRVDYVLSKNFLFAHVESCCVLEFSCHMVGMCILGSLVACVLLIFGSIYMM